ncbi:MAG: hypothetical protein NTW07_01990 [candidate division Zixibacteria bacterium]|nr:hypothetical protein [candidate division Zixibacteria bacterium]
MIAKRIAITYTFLFLFVFTFALSFTLALAEQPQEQCCIVSYCASEPSKVEYWGHMQYIGGYTQ